MFMLRKPLPRTHAPGWTLLELLICVAIISILAGICMVSYQGSLDMSEMNFFMDNMVREINENKGTAMQSGHPVTVTFQPGTPDWVIEGTGENGPFRRTGKAGEGILKRKLVFRKYKWPDGREEPASFTFHPSGAVEGGEVTFGSGWAEKRIHIRRSRVFAD